MTKLLLDGALLTLEISFAGIVIGLIFGTLLGVINCNKLRNRYVGAAVTFFVTIWRGTPMFVQLLFVYFALPDLFGIDLQPIPAGVITLGLNSSAYLSETIRGGINAVAEGQWEATHVLGYTKTQALRWIILPQALRTVAPAITNELVTLVKDSSILMVIGVPEIIKVSRDIVARELNPAEVYVWAALVYLILTTTLSLITKKIERGVA